jgi:hypothetical protein
MNDILYLILLAMHSTATLVLIYICFFFVILQQAHVDVIFHIMDSKGVIAINLIKEKVCSCGRQSVAVRDMRHACIERQDHLIH